MNVLQRLQRAGHSFFYGFLVLFLACLHLGACHADSGVSLDDTDRKFAGFYSDYLVQCGVSGHEEDVVLAPLREAQLETMLERHSLTREKLEKRVRLYREQPERWKKVVKLVRAEVQKKMP